jgi:hypothetical protein
VADELTHMAKFTPTSVDRDAILYAAGRASAPSCRPWQVACAGLLTLQAVAVAVLLTYPLPTPAVAEPLPTPTVVPEEPQPRQPPDPSSYLALMAHFDDPPPPLPSGSFAPPSQPLTVRSTLD